MAWTEADDPDYLAQPVAKPHVITLHASVVDCKCMPAVYADLEAGAVEYREHEPNIARTRAGIGHP
jgi:hypothetical protein